MGSLITAVASYLDARFNNGKWLIRTEDLDPPREIAGASDAIITALAQHGLVSDAPILKQSERLDAYEAAITALTQLGRAYLCRCSRSELRDSNGIYPGYCRDKNLSHNQQLATRLIVNDETITYHDGIQGLMSQSLGRDIGDFVIKRKDQLHSYQLAVVIDDAFQGITHVVRGADLLDSTERQIFLADQLNYPRIQFSHLPVLTNALGQKLSKQTFAPIIDNSRVMVNLRFALAFLNQPSAPQHIVTSGEILAWSAQHWDIGRIAKKQHHYSPLPT